MTTKVSYLSIIIFSFFLLALGCAESPTTKSEHKSKSKPLSLTQPPEIINLLEEDWHILELGHGLFTATAKNAKDEQFYLGFEPINNDNRYFWDNYRSQAISIGDDVQNYLKKIWKNKVICYKNIGVINSLSKKLGLSEIEFTDLIDFLKKHKKNDYNNSDDNTLYNLFSDVKGGLAGMWTKDHSAAASKRKEKYYAIYVSKKPVIISHTNSDFDEDKNFDENFDDITMVMIGITSDNVPSVTHFGINRNITNFLQKKYMFSGISMILHGFAAAVWLSHFDDKKYMVTEPLASMANIFKNKLKSSDVFIGSYPPDLATVKNTGKKVNFAKASLFSTTTTVLLKPMADLYKKYVLSSY